MIYYKKIPVKIIQKNPIIYKNFNKDCIVRYIGQTLRALKMSDLISLKQP